MPMIGNPLSDLKKPNLKAQYMVGYVVNNVDEDDKKQRQRIKIRIPLLHRNISDEDLPWSIPDIGMSYGNAGSGVGSVNIPPVGSKIYMRIDENDPHNPRYSGSPSTDDANGDNELFKENYPHTRGSVDAANNRESTNVELNTQDKVHNSGTTIHIDANGSMSIATAGDYNLGVNGNINIAATGVVKIDGSEVRINEGGSPTSTSPRPRPEIDKKENKKDL